MILGMQSTARRLTMTGVGVPYIKFKDALSRTIEWYLAGRTTAQNLSDDVS